MMPVKIVTDSGSDISQEEAQETEKIVSIHTTSKHSGTCNPALAGVKRWQKRKGVVLRSSILEVSSL